MCSAFCWKTRKKNTLSPAIPGLPLENADILTSSITWLVNLTKEVLCPFLFLICNGHNMVSVFLLATHKRACLLKPSELPGRICFWRPDVIIPWSDALLGSEQPPDQLNTNQTMCMRRGKMNQLLVPVLPWSLQWSLESPLVTEPRCLHCGLLANEEKFWLQFYYFSLSFCWLSWV